MKVNVGCGPHRAEGWWNVDRVCEGDVQPDAIVSAARPLASFSEVEAVYCGHVLEHIAWPKVPAFLGHIRDHLAPGGACCVVGPDVERALAAWHRGLEPRSLVTSVLESDRPQDDLGDWPGARHAWNCTEERVVRAMSEAGFARVEALSIDPVALAGWPVVAFTQWQCAVVGWES